MASIIKRKEKYCVVYRVTDNNGITRQRWETFNSNTEAKKRKTQIEYELQNNTFIVPEAKTVSDLMNDYVNLYGINKWAMSTYEHNVSLIANYVNPIIGDMELQKINTRTIETYYRSLLKVKAVHSLSHDPNNTFVTPQTIRNIHKMLRSAFHQAVKWELIQKNPCDNATTPSSKSKKREIWDAETLFRAIELCDDDIIKLALNLAFCCSLRIGEMLGLTWDCVDISDESIEQGKALIYINKELQRVNKEAMEKLGDKDVLYKFPAIFCRNTTALVLKTPKTESSIRRIYVPKTVALMLKQRYEDIQDLKDLFGEEFTDYNLVFSNANGKPIEGQVISRGLQILIREHNLPPIVFHSLRHSSITYKLKLNGGDIKSVQGDSGHAQMKMVTDVYSHILDEDRRMNAERFEQQFYSGKGTAAVTKTTEGQNNDDKSDVEKLIELLQKPELAALVKALNKD